VRRSYHAMRGSQQNAPTAPRPKRNANTAVQAAAEDANFLTPLLSGRVNAVAHLLPRYIWFGPRPPSYTSYLH
jgi:hypothetical protein